MSRSYRKTPIVKDNKNGRKFAKRQANKRVRRNEDVPNGKQYRKYYNPWDIYDWITFCSFEEYKSWGWVFEEDKSEEEMYAEWKKRYKCK